jgi:glucoamylase
MWPATPSPSDRRAAVTWSPGAKDGVGTAIGARSRVWFTLSHGVVTEVFYPSVDRANTRALYLVVVCDGRVFVDGAAAAVVRAVAPWAPAYRVRTTLGEGQVVIHKTIITDTERSVLLEHVRLESPPGRASAVRAFVMLEPHVGNNGSSNDAWLGEYKGEPAVLARHGQAAIALLCSRPFVGGVCAYVGKDDALADLRSNARLTISSTAATSGNIQAAAEVALDETREFVLALGFGESPDQAAQQARASLLDDFDRKVRTYVRGWQRYRHRYRRDAANEHSLIDRVHAASVTMLRAHEDKERGGAIIASVAIPWGNAHGDHNAGGYRLVWPRDLVEAAGALLAVGLPRSARRTLSYLMSTQEHSGAWPQNMWLDGTPSYRGMQLDEVSLPILLASKLGQHQALETLDPWPMIRAAASYLVRTGPVTPEDRWEEEGGYAPYTIAAEIAALVAAAQFATQRGEHELARFLCETADYWNSSLERWTYVSGTPTARRHGVEGYYVRLAPPGAIIDGWHVDASVPLTIKNQRCADTERPYGEIVSPDALALVRFGLRRASDPRIRDTISVIDAELQTITARGPVWHRYLDDGYGEPADGSPHQGWGIGRGWPLLSGERAHYEIANRQLDRARVLCRAMASQANQTGLLPEQIWDAADIPEHGLFNGCPTGSAMPLVWAHAEFLKLCRSLRDGRVFDMPEDAAKRYLGNAPESSLVVWRAGQHVSVVPRGLTLRVESGVGREVRWRNPAGEQSGCIPMRDLGIGLRFADLPTAELPSGAELCFRFEGSEHASGERRVRVE